MAYNTQCSICSKCQISTYNGISIGSMNLQTEARMNSSNSNSNPSQTDIHIFIGDSSQIGGAERVMILWANYFVGEGFKVCVVGESANKPFVPLLPGVSQVVLPMSLHKSMRRNPLLLLKRLGALVRWSKSYPNPGVVLLNKQSQIIPFVLLKVFGLLRGKKVYYFSHAGTRRFHNSFPMWSQIGALRILDGAVCLYDDKRELFQSRGASKVKILSNPVSFESKSVSNLNAKGVLYVGRLSREKRVDFLLRTWAIFSARNPEWKLTIVGDGPEERDLKLLAEDLQIQSSIEFAGASLSPHDFYLNASIFVMASEYEGLPMALMEAKVYGIPVVSTQNDGALQLVKDGTTGFICNNPENFAARLEMLARDPELRIRMGRNALNDLDLFKIENVSKAWATILGNYKK